LAKQRQVPFDISLNLAKGLRMGSVQTNVKDYNRQLRASSPPARPSPASASHTTSASTRPGCLPAFRHPRLRTKVVLNPTKG
jgi:hypothetical protein